MAGTTTRYGIPYPSATDNNNVPADIQALANAVDTKLGTLEDRAIDLAHLAQAVQDLLVPTGSVFTTARTTPPNGYLLCDGSAISRTTYSALYTAIGVTYGTGDGSTTFNLPDLRGRTPIGVGTATGAHGATAHTLAQKGGEESHTLSTAEMPQHRVWNDEGVGTPLGVANGNFYGPYSGFIGGNGDHNTMQPYLVLNYIIKI